MNQLHDIAWLVSCGILVMLMQAGFACLESGFVRAKNSINVAIKNLVDFCVAALLFWAAGYAFMFGATANGVIGTTGFFFAEPDQPWLTAFFFFELVFCGTATTIVSGAVAERMTFKGYLIAAAITSFVVYPVVGHWVWGGMTTKEAVGWLNSRGFVDFAGSTAVHSIGGWVSLAAIIILGPRLGRFDRPGERIPGHDLTLATLGALLLWVGWFGFNAGSTLAVTASIPTIVVNTTIAGAAGALAALAMAWWLTQRPDVPLTINGALAGLIAITASAHAVTPIRALVIGAIGAGVMVSVTLLLERFKVDDTVGAVPAHAGAGVWGTLAVGLFGDPLLLGTGLGRWEQIGIQAVGVGACFVWSFGASYGLLWLVNRALPLRVSREAEQEGLNRTEHAATTVSLELLKEMDHQRRTGNFLRHVSVEPHTEIGEIAYEYNKVLDRVAEETTEREAVLRRLRESKEQMESVAQELSKTNVELVAARDQALQAARAKAEFLATMTHEIRTPLNGILGMADLLRQSQLPNKQQRLADTVHRSGTTLLQIMNDILDYAKIEAGKLELEQIPMEVRRIAEDVRELFAEQAAAKGLTLGVVVDPDVPAMVQGDPTRLSQILMNLVGNALKFTEQGRIDVQVTIAERGVEGVRLRFDVRDTGIGIPESAQARIFESFAQADGSTTRKYGGTGLGLAICKQLVSQMGGEIGVQSQPSQGATFWFTMRCLEHNGMGENQPACAEGIAAGGGSKPFAKNPMTPSPSDAQGNILLVEDNPVNQEVAVSMLESLGYSVEIAADGQQAVDRCAQGPFDLILMDCQMPVLDGYNACRAIRQRESAASCRTPIVALTAHALKGDREQCLAAGMDDYLTKPFSRQQLDEVVRRWMKPSGVMAAEGKSQRVEQASNARAGSLQQVEMAQALDAKALAQLYQLRRAGRPDPVPKILTSFLDGAEGYIQTIQTAIAQRDATALFHAAHALKSSSAMIGAIALSNLATEFEEMGRKQTGFPSADQLAAFEAVHMAVRDAVNREIQKEAA